jgi:hypothetical protein
MAASGISFQETVRPRLRHVSAFDQTSAFPVAILGPDAKVFKNRSSFAEYATAFHNNNCQG